MRGTSEEDTFLLYAFIPSTVKVGERIDLTVIISNPYETPITVKKIDIKIPVGQDYASYLSTAMNLPEPSYSNADCLITSDGSHVSIQSANEDSLEISTQGIVFKLKDIEVNDVAGVVLVTVTQYSTTGQRQTSGNTYTLAKT